MDELVPDGIFREFQTAYEQASPEEKKRLLDLFYTWADQQPDLRGMPAFRNNSRHTSDDGGPAPLVPPEAIKPSAGGDINLLGVLKLVRNEIHLDQIMREIDQVIWLREIDSDRMLYVNPTFETVWGRPCESLYANPAILIESVHPEDRVQVMAARPQGFQKPFNQVYRILRPDGSLRWIFSRSFVLRNGSGEASSLFCMAEDITDQKQVELALRKTLDRIREQFDLSRKMSLAHRPEAVLKTLMSAHELRSAQRAALLFFDDPKIGPTQGMEMATGWVSNQGLSTWLSEPSLYEEPAFMELLQANRTTVINRIESDLRLSPQVRDILLEGQNQTLVIFPMVALGDWLGCLAIYYNKAHPFDHNELRHLKVLIDQASTTLYNLQLLKVEEELRREAERATEIKTEFLAMISHELRTPLTSIIGFTTTLLADDVSWNAEEQRDFIQTIQIEANRLQELINHLLDLSRMEAGMLPIEPNPISLQKIIEDVLPQIQVLTQGHTFTMHLPANLPKVQADAKRIAQVLVNLVRNSSIYSPKGTEITLSANPRGGYMQINVSDRGPGIPLAEHKRVFKAFQRGKDVENGAGQGAGLGLAICKGLVEAHGGRIWIKKKNTPGATVCLTIPLAQTHPAVAEKE